MHATIAIIQIGFQCHKKLLAMKKRKMNKLLNPVRMIRLMENFKFKPRIISINRNIFPVQKMHISIGKIKASKEIHHIPFPKISLALPVSLWQVMIIELEGSLLFRERIILSILSGKSIKISKIRSDQEDLGLQKGEISFLRLIEKVTEGSTIEINHTGTCVKFHPGIIKGGEVEHECDLSKSIGFYLEPLIAIAPFSKFAFKLSLFGITTALGGENGISVDALKLGYLPLLKHYGIENMDLVQLQINKRGAAPSGGGEVFFTCPVILSLNPWTFQQEGKVCKIRGVATACRVSPQIANRLVEASRSHLNPFLNDIYIHTDVLKGPESGKSPGWNLCLVAETTKGSVYFADAQGGPNVTPEDVAEQVSKELLKKISIGGVVDCKLHRMLMLMMACGPSDLFKAKISAPSSLTKHWLSELNLFMGVAFKMRNNLDRKTSKGSVDISVIGTGFVNLGKRTQ